MNITSKFLRYWDGWPHLIWSEVEIQIANESQWEWVYSGFTHNRLATFRDMSFLRMGSVSFFPMFHFHAFFFLFVVPSVSLFPCTYPLPLSFTFFPPEVSPWECDCSHSFLCYIAFARRRKETAENLCRYNRPFNRVCFQSTSLWKTDVPLSVFHVQAADQRSPIQVLTQRRAAWLGWPRGTGHLPHAERCRYFSCVVSSTFHRR